MAVTSVRIAVAAAALVALVGVWKWGELYGRRKEAASPAAVMVRAAEVTQGAVTAAVTNIGTVQALNTVLVRARIDGVINKVLFKEGQIVKEGDVLVQLDPLPFEAQLRVSQAQLAKDTALLENAKTDLQRYEGLVKADSISTQTRDTARSMVEQLTAAIANDAAQVDLARLSLSYTTIKAPLVGRVGARLIDAGNIVHTTDANGLVVITQESPIAVNFAVPQERLADLRAAQTRGSIPVHVLSDTNGLEESDGEVILIDNQIDPTTGTIRCKAQFANPHDALWPGQFVTVRADLGVVPGALLIPSVAIQNGGDGPFVYIIDATHHAKVRTIKTGAVDGDRTVVTSGLAAGEAVVTEGQFRVDEGTLVQIDSTNASPAASASAAATHS